MKSNQTNEDEQRLNKKENIEVWEDLVNIKSLVFALSICTLTMSSGYYIGHNNELKSLLFGLIGAIIGFFISTILITPKRILREEENN